MWFVDCSCTEILSTGTFQGMEKIKMRSIQGNMAHKINAKVPSHVKIPKKGLVKCRGPAIDFHDLQCDCRHHIVMVLNFTSFIMLAQNF